MTKTNILTLLISFICFGFVINVRAQFENKKNCGKNEDDKCFHTELTYAARMGDAEKVKALLAAGSAVDERNFFKRTALKEAIVYRHREIVKVMIDAGADVNDDEALGGTPLYLATVVGASEIFNDLIIAGADFTWRLPNGKTLLIVAACPPGLKILETLLSLQVNINAVDEAGRNALTNAILNCFPPDFSCIKYLIKSGIDVNTKDRDGLTALDHAKREMKNQQYNEAKEIYSSIIRILRKAGAIENKN